MPNPKNILHHMQDVHLDRNYPPRTHRMEYNFGMEADPVTTELSGMMPVEYDYVGRLEVWFRQRVQRNASQDQRALYRERAQRAIAQHLYADIVSDLRALYNDLLTYGTEDEEGRAIRKKVGDMIDTLSGSFERFER